MENYKPRHAKNDIDLMENFNEKELRMLRAALTRDIVAREEKNDMKPERIEQYINLLDKVYKLIEAIKE